MNGVEANNIRSKIKTITKEILRLAAERRRLSLEISDIKYKLGMDILDRHVEAELLKDSLRYSKELGLDEYFTRRLISILISDSVKAQEEKILGLEEVGLREVFYMALELEKSGRKVIRLEIGEPDFTAPPKVVEGTCRALKEGRSKYLPSYGVAELRRAIAERINTLYGTDLKPENVLITCGGIMAIHIAIQVLSSMGDEVIVPEPAWPLYRQITEHLGRRYIPLRTSLDDKWTLSPGKIQENVTDASKLLIINYPNNPTGRALSIQELKTLVGEAREHGLTIISDEVYSQYYFHRGYAPSIVQVLDEGYVLIGSFSKTYGMTGYRIGYLVGDKKIIDKAASILGLMITCVPEFIQTAALKALQHYEYVKKNIEETKKRVNYMFNELSKNSLIEVYQSDGAFYLFPKINLPAFNSSEFALNLLKEHGVAVAPGSSFGPYRQYIRLSAVKPIDEIRIGLEILNQVIAQLQ